MIIGASALLAILRNEADGQVFADAIETATTRRLSTATFVEAAIVIDRSNNPISSRRFDDLIEDAQLIFEPVTESQARLARAAYRDFGKGSGHPAQLNYGDCFAYALAKELKEPLLFKGSDFSQTDITPALRVKPNF